MGNQNLVNEVKSMVKKERIRFLKHSIKFNGKKARVRYSQGELYGFPKGTVTIYAKDYGVQLPRELKPKNQTDYQTDYFETDRARIKPKSKHYKAVRKVLKQMGL